MCESPVETVRLEEVESSLQTVDLSEETQPEPTDVKVKEESKPRKTPLMAFLRQMVSHFRSLQRGHACPSSESRGSMCEPSL